MPTVDDDTGAGRTGDHWCQSFDVNVWVEKWMMTIKEHPNVPNDPETMRGWFANAMMAGYDHARRQDAPGFEPFAVP